VSSDEPIQSKTVHGTGKKKTLSIIKIYSFENKKDTQREKERERERWRGGEHYWRSKSKLHLLVVISSN